MENLALEIGEVNGIEIDEADAAYSCGGQIEAERSTEANLSTAWSAEIRDEPSYEPEPESDMPEATAEI